MFSVTDIGNFIRVVIGVSDRHVSILDGKESVTNLINLIETKVIPEIQVFSHSSLHSSDEDEDWFVNFSTPKHFRYCKNLFNEISKVVEICDEDTWWDYIEEYLLQRYFEE